jgi:hypothetical protein
MKCINKSHPNFKKLEKRLGELGAELSVRHYSKIKSKTDDFIYPDVKDLNSFYSSFKSVQERLISSLLSLDPNMSKGHLMHALTGIVTGPRDQIKSDHIVMGFNDNNELKDQNIEIFKRLSTTFPNIFQFKEGGINSQYVYIRDGHYNSDISLEDISSYLTFDNSISDFLKSMKSINKANPRFEASLEVLLHKLESKFHVPWKFDYRTPKKGYIKDGIVYINPNYATVDTAIHEYLHPFIELVRLNNKTLYTLLSNKAKTIEYNGSKLIDQIKLSYPEYSDDNLIYETIVTAAGLISTGELTEPIVQSYSLFDLIDKIISYFMQLFGKVKDFKVNPSTPLTTLLNGFLSDDFSVNLKDYAFAADQRLSPSEVNKVLDDINSNVEVTFVKGELDIDEPKRKYIDKRSQQIFKSVHEAIVDVFYKETFKKQFSPTEKSEYLKNVGTVFHNYIEQILSDKFTIVDKDGYLRDDLKKLDSSDRSQRIQSMLDSLVNDSAISSPEDNNKILLDSDAANTLKSVIADFLPGMIEFYIERHGIDVQFKTEQKIINPETGIAGTIDLLILGKGSFSIVDWKTLSASRYDKYNNTFTEIEILSDKKETAYALQLSEYAKMVKRLTGLDFIDGRAIPVGLFVGKQSEFNLFTGTFDKSDDYTLNSYDPNREPITIQPFGSTEIKQEGSVPQRYLLPIIVSDENEDHINTLINKLESLLKNYIKQQEESREDREFLKSLRFREIRKIIQDLKVRKSADAAKRRINMLILESEKELTKETSDINLKKIQDLIYELNVYSNLSTYFPLEDQNNEEDKGALALLERKILLTVKSLKNLRNDILSEQAQGFGIYNLTSNEKAYSGAKRHFREFSAISDVKTIAFLNAKQNLLFNKANIEKLKHFKQLSEFSKLSQYDFDYFFQKNRQGKRIPKLIAKIDKGKILTEVNKLMDTGDINNLYAFEDEYFTRNEEAFNNARSKYEQFLLSTLDFINVPLEEESEEEFYHNQALRDKLNELLTTWENENNSPFIERDGTITNINWRFFNLNEQGEKIFQTKDYIKLSESEDRVKLYNALIDINTKAFQEGLIPNKFTFYPSAYATITEKLQNKNFEDISLANYYKKLKENINDEDSLAETIINPITGEEELVIPKLFQQDISNIKDHDLLGKLSILDNEDFSVSIQERGLRQTLELAQFDIQDINKVLNLGFDPNAKNIDKYDIINELKDYSNQSFNLLKVYSLFSAHLEEFKAKQSLEELSRILIEIEKDKENLQVNKDGNIVYSINISGEKIPQVIKGHNENTELLRRFISYSVYGKSGFSELAKFAGNTILNTNISTVKTVKKLMSWRSMTTLGLNILSASSALFGGLSNILLESNRNGFFTKSDVALSKVSLANSFFNDTAKERMRLLDSIDSFIEDSDRIRGNKLSKVAFEKHFTQEKLYFMLRNVDKYIQNIIGLSTLNNFMIKDNELINIRDLAKKELSYDQQFDSMISLKEYENISKLNKELEDKIKELQKESLFNKPDVDLSEENIIKLRPLIQKLTTKVIGNSSHEDKNSFGLSALGVISMQFKNWMPRLVTERFGDPEMDNVTKTLNWGKYMTFKDLIGKDFLSLTRSAFSQMNDVSYEKMLTKYNNLKEQHLLNGGSEDNFISFSDFSNLYINNIRSTFKELLIITSLLIAILTIGMAWDDDEPKSGYQRLVLNMLGKFKNELTFYINPVSFTDLVNKPFPVVQTLVDGMRFGEHMSRYSFNQAQNIFTNNEQEDIEKTHPFKYFSKLFPIAKEMMNWMAIVDEDFRKKHNISLRYN